MLRETTFIEILTAKTLRAADSPYPQDSDRRLSGSSAHPPPKNQLAPGGQPKYNEPVLRSLTPPAARGAFVGRSHWQRQSQISWQWISRTSPIRNELTRVITGLLSRKTYFEAQAHAL
jgi:hypothetical protein